MRELTLILFLAVQAAIARADQRSTSGLSGGYSDATLSFRYTPPSGMHDKTQRFRSQIEEQAKAQRATKTLSALLAMSSGPDDKDPSWRSLTIETYPRDAVSEPDDAKAEARMSAWVAHSSDTTALPRQRDAESGNDYALARSYASTQGRFLAPDPLEGVVGDPQSWNRYAYVENDPINLSDPSGQGFWEDLGFAIADIFIAIFAPEFLPTALQRPSIAVCRGRHQHVQWAGR